MSAPSRSGRSDSGTKYQSIPTRLTAPSFDYAMRKGGDMVAVCVVWIDRDGMVCTRWSCDIPEMAAMTAAMNKYLHEEL